MSIFIALLHVVPVLQELLKTVNPEGDGYITIDEFYSAMKRPGVTEG